jgi:hypothetical protein
MPLIDYTDSIVKMLNISYRDFLNYLKVFDLLDTSNAEKTEEVVKKLYNIVVKLNTLRTMYTGPAIELTEGAYALLAYACEKDNLINLEFFVKQNPHILYRKLDNFGNTGLHYLCLLGKFDLIQPIIKHNVDLKYINGVGVNSLEFAVFSGHEESVKAIFKLFNTADFFTPKIFFFIGLSCSKYLIHDVFRDLNKENNWSPQLLEKIEEGIFWHQKDQKEMKKYQFTFYWDMRLYWKECQLAVKTGEPLPLCDSEFINESHALDPSISSWKKNIWENTESTKGYKSPYPLNFLALNFQAALRCEKVDADTSIEKSLYAP